MNILFIIGNGFDINLGMETKYSQFYKHYQSIENTSNCVKKLKNSISSDYKSWSDLEMALGKYTENIESLEEFDELIEDIGEQLANYLTLEESNFPFEKIDKNKLFEYLSFPENCLTVGQSEEIKDFRNKWSNHYWYLNLVTLNYTRSIEHIIGEFNGSINVGMHHKTAPIDLLTIEHIYGFVDERMIIGVNDISQIVNEKFHNVEEILESLIKTKCNKALNHKIDRTFENHIKTANLICIFGSSIGETDNCWWESIGERLKEDCRLIIFSKGEEIKPRVAHKNNRTARKTKDLFLDRTRLSEEDKAKISDKIFVGINTEMFSKMVNK